MLKSERLQDMRSTLSTLYDTNKKYNSTLMELTTRDYKFLKEHCIHVTGIIQSLNGNATIYKTIKYGKAISVTKKTLSIAVKNKYRYINLTKSKGNIVLITADKIECLTHNPNTLTFPTNMSHKHVTDDVLSGKVILMTGKLRNKNDLAKQHYIWNNSVHDLVKLSKVNSLDSFDHHGSKGFVYSFGNKPLYGMKDGSSVSLYANKKSKSVTMQSKINDNADEIEIICSRSINIGISTLSTVLPDIKNLISPIIDAAYHRQKAAGISLLQKTSSSDNGCWNSFLNVNARTQDYHTETDCAYTFVTVPTQVVNKSITIAAKPVFLFKITEQVELMLPLCNDLTFVYNACYLTHKQSYNQLGDRRSVNFYNITSYANEKNFNHLRKSFERSSNNGV